MIGRTEDCVSKIYSSDELITKVLLLAFFESSIVMVV